MIAYAAVHVQPYFLHTVNPDHSDRPSHPQTYIGLSSLRSWGPSDGTFSLIRFYHLIVKTLSDDTDDWVAETMNWWKR